MSDHEIDDIDDIDDIEELATALDDVAKTHGRASQRTVAVKRFGAASGSLRRQKAPTPATEDDDEEEPADDDDDEGTTLGAAGAAAAGGEGFQPGRAAVYLRTWGCSHNNSDSEYMAGILAAHGYTLTRDAEAADVWVLNSCTVKNPSEQTFVNAVDRGRALGKRLVVAGCVPQGQPGKGTRWDGLSVIGVQQIEHIVYVVEETLQGHTVRLLDTKKVKGSEDGAGGGKRKDGGARLALPKIRKNPLVEIIPINTGCLNQCTYCKTKHARGELGSYPVDEIVARVRAVLAEGVVEIWLTSEDSGAYGRDIGTSLPDLMRAVIAELPDHAMLRVGMTNPPYILEHLDAVAELLAHPRVYAFLHVPVQSGSDRVLVDMRRQYTCAEFEHVVEVLTTRVPGGCTVATDVICGFPTEGDEDWNDTMTLIAKYRFPAVHISQFYPRPGTPAARLLRLPTALVKSRSRAMTALFDSYTPYDGRVGETMRVLVTDVAADGRHYVGHGKKYEQVLVPMAAVGTQAMGAMVDVEIVATTKFAMIAKAIAVHPPPFRAPGLDGGDAEQVAAVVKAGVPQVSSRRRVKKTETETANGAAPTPSLPAAAAARGLTETEWTSRSVEVVTARERQLARLSLVGGVAAFGAAFYVNHPAAAAAAFAAGIGALFAGMALTSGKVAEFHDQVREAREARDAVRAEVEAVGEKTKAE
ncbi:hypothetical protein H9P43_005782 [Blastocladiella emersonii ATCC 22665]|nr:hypothetical protein H9P43_005782 [Blastocladiella emersonii ATCC 22665]